MKVTGFSGPVPIPTYPQHSKREVSINIRRVHRKMASDCHNHVQRLHFIVVNVVVDDLVQDWRQCTRSPVRC